MGDAADELDEGTLIRGKYRVKRRLGQGGMGRVVEATHVGLDQKVAIKVLNPDLRQNTDLVERFLREGRAASQIEGDHVARVIDVDRLDDGTPFLVMEYLEGHDLSNVRRARSPLPIVQAIELVIQACTAIAEAHSIGIIHRDIKPANLFLTQRRDGSTRLKVLDFGISKHTGIGASEPSMTKTSLIMGSAEYMSPEQMLSTRDVDVRADIWALGVVLFELVTATVPFAGDSVTQVCALVMSRPPPLPRSLRADLPPALEAIILKCLEKDREHRFATVPELSNALHDCLTAILGAPPPTAIKAAWAATQKLAGKSTQPIPLAQFSGQPVSGQPNPQGSFSQSPSHQGPGFQSAPGGQQSFQQSPSFQQPYGPQYPTGPQQSPGYPDQGGHPHVGASALSFGDGQGLPAGSARHSFPSFPHGLAGTPPPPGIPMPGSGVSGSNPAMQTHSGRGGTHAPVSSGDELSIPKKSPVAAIVAGVFGLIVVGLGVSAAVWMFRAPGRTTTGAEVTSSAPEANSAATGREPSTVPSGPTIAPASSDAPSVPPATSASAVASSASTGKTQKNPPPPVKSTASTKSTGTPARPPPARTTGID